MVEGNEVCDGADLGGGTCATADPNKFAAGTLACTGTCDAFDTAQCNAGNCCTSHGPTCEVSTVSQCVCAIDPFCCNNSWDGICVNEAKNNCGAVCP